MIGLDDIQGHWVRKYIKAPGFEDHTTRVHWMQVGTDYADLRVPLHRPDLTAYAALSDVPAECLLELAAAEGFAGHVTLEGPVCTWHREVNWHGAPDVADVGEISFDDAGRMIEAGVLAEYTELWEQSAPDALGRSIRFGGEGYAGVMVVLGQAFVLGIGRPDKLSTKPQLAGLQQGRVDAALWDAFDGVHALGRLVGNVAHAKLATQPFAEAHPIVTLDGESVIWHRTEIDGTRQDIELCQKVGRS